jgi:plasmid stabilization system protein ParE
VIPVVYAPEALEDLEDIVAFLGGQDPELVQKFEADYRAALGRIRDFPQAWPKVGRSVRVKIISKRFQYGIYYQYFQKAIFIGAVIQLARRGGWRKRF